jgi:phosphoribosylformylglycinamidine cyclo-ligase
MIPATADAVIDRTTWEWPRIFSRIQELGAVADAEMEKVFNLGIGMVVAVPEEQVAAAVDSLQRSGHRARRIGGIVDGSGHVRLEG